LTTRASGCLCNDDRGDATPAALHAGAIRTGLGVVATEPPAAVGPDSWWAESLNIVSPWRGVSGLPEEEFRGALNLFCTPAERP
jgi:hypothetical protein